MGRVTNTPHTEEAPHETETGQARRPSGRRFRAALLVRSSTHSWSEVQVTDPVEAACERARDLSPTALWMEHKGWAS